VWKLIIKRIYSIAISMSTSFIIFISLYGIKNTEQIIINRFSSLNFYKQMVVLAIYKESVNLPGKMYKIHSQYISV